MTIITDHRFRDMHEVIAKNKSAGFHFFDTDTKTFFGSRVLPTLYGGKWFITSEWTNWYRDHRAWTIREAQEDGGIETVGEFLQYGSLADTKRAVKAMVKEERMSNGDV